MLTALSVPARDAATGGSGGEAALRGRRVEESVRAAKTGVSNLATGTETACTKVLGCRTERARKEGEMLCRQHRVEMKECLNVALEGLNHKWKNGAERRVFNTLPWRKWPHSW